MSLLQAFMLGHSEKMSMKGGLVMEGLALGDILYLGGLAIMGAAAIIHVGYCFITHQPY